MYVETVLWCGVSLAVLTFLCLIYALLTRKTRNPNPRRYGKNYKYFYLKYPFAIVNKSMFSSDSSLLSNPWTDYSDYLEDLSKEDEFYEYRVSKDTIKTILPDFHKNCYLHLENLKAKHRRELRLLARLKQEAAEKKAENIDNNSKKKNVKKNFFGFKAQNSIVRYVNGVVS